MRFRCKQCRALTQVQIPASVASSFVASCSGCGRGYRFAVDRRHGATDQERYRRAKEFAEVNGIDLAGAYSVLEGVMTLEEARGLARVIPQSPSAGLESPAATTAVAKLPAATATPPANLPAAPRAVAGPAAADRSRAAAGIQASAPTRVAVASGSASGPRSGRGPGLAEAEVPYDPAFSEAVRDGCLSIQQAVERGDRRALAARLAQRHRLSMNLACKVADNRITIHQALQQKAAIESREPPRPQTSISHGVWNFMITSIGLMVASAFAFRAYQEWEGYFAQRGMLSLGPRMANAAVRPVARPAPAPPVPQPPPPLTVPKTDATGQLVEVVGPDPKSVLIAFCSTGRQGGLREPMDVVTGVPPNAALRFGLFRHLDQPGMAVRAIRIRRDANSGRWVSGDGRNPIMTERAPGAVSPSEP